LLGNIHALKHVAWEPTVGDAPTVAELLIGRGVRVVSALQDWPGECDQRDPILRESDHPEALGAVAEVFAPMAAQAPSDPASVADEVLVWACQ
jgi:hypothetical protein